MRRRDAFAFSLLGITALAAGAVLPGALALALGAELALVGVTYLDGHAPDPRATRLALLLSLLHGLMLLALRVPGLSADLCTLLEARHALAQVMTATLAGAFFRFIAQHAAPPLTLVALLTAALSAALRRVPRGLTRIAAVEVIALGLLRLLAPPPPLPPRSTPFDARYAAALHDAHPGAPLQVEPLPPLAHVEGPDTLVVVLESVGAENLAAHRAGHPGCLFSELATRGFFAEVIPAAAVTHIAQPGLIFSRWLAYDAQNHLLPPPLPRPSLSLPAYFHAKGFATVLASSMDERWLGLDRFTLAEPWDLAFHAGSPNSAGEVDRCGTLTVPDATTVARLLAEAPRIAAGRPLLALLSLQDTHYPYRTRAGRLQADCLQSTRMAPSLLPEAKASFEEALLASEARIAALRATFPRLVITGDHGEAFAAGESFGHGKDTGHAADATFLLAVGPGVPVRALPRPLSALDLLPTLIAMTDPRDHLPRGLLDGRDALSDPDPDPPIFTAALGFRVELAVLQGGARFFWRPHSAEGCTSEPDGRPLDPADPRCVRLSALLAQVMACRQAFHAAHPDAVDPCLPGRAIVRP